MFSLSALIIGFLGSFHCVAMCGPIALAITNRAEGDVRFFINRSIYNLGRILTYAFLGLLAGSAGHIFLLAGFQSSISIGIGVLMIITVMLLYFIPERAMKGIVSIKLNQVVKRLLSNQIKKRNRLSLLFTGMANGILPCGFVYVAVAGAAATQEPAHGMVYMVMFGLGTFPAMMLVSLFGKFAGIKFRNLISKASPVFMVLLGLFFIYRGMMISNNNHCHGNVLPVTSSIELNIPG